MRYGVKFTLYRIKSVYKSLDQPVREKHKFQNQLDVFFCYSL